MSDVRTLTDLLFAKAEGGCFDSDVAEGITLLQGATINPDDIQVIGPAQAPVVLTVPVQELAEVFTETIWGVQAIKMLLDHLTIAIPKGYGTVDDAKLRLWTTGGATITVEVKDGYTPRDGQRVAFLGKKEE